MRTAAGEAAPKTKTARPLGALIAGLPEARLVGTGATSITGLTYDSRNVRPGDLFCALAGGYFDGHDYASAAVASGAAALIVERPLSLDVPQIVVEDSRAALAPISAEFYGHPSQSLDVIGVTGTDGKTTTAYLLEAIFGHAGIRTGVMGTIGVRVGDVVLDRDTRQTTPESADVQSHLREMKNAGAEVAILEATSHGLDLHRLDCVRFRTGVVTNITHEHLEHHKTIEAYRKAKAKLFEAVDSAGGTAVVNLDDEGARAMLPYVNRATLITYGLERRDVDVAAIDVGLGPDHSTYTLTHGADPVRVNTPLVGGFNVANALAATAAAIVHDISLQVCADALAEFRGVPGRMQAIRVGQPFSVIVDYAHTPESIEKVLSLLRSLNASGRLILVMGSAGERDPTKRPLQGAVGARLADLCVFTTEDPRFEDPDQIIDQIAAGAREWGAREGVDFVCITGRREAITHALSAAQPGDTVLLAGKGHERSIIWRHEKHPWDEAAIVAEVLAGLGFDSRRSQ